MAEPASTLTAPRPVMDVVAPPVEKVEKTEAAPETQTDPLDKLVADDQKSQQAATHDKNSHKPVEKKPIAKPAQAAHHGVGAAITATVIIVLGLAVLATYAYLQTNK